MSYVLILGYNKEVIMFGKSWGETLLGTVFLAGMYMIGHTNGRAETIKDLKEALRDDEITDLRRRLNELNEMNQRKI